MATPIGTPHGIGLRHLRYFLAVIEELHFHRAADRLRIAQPPLSQAIRRLEEELGVQLLERTSRTVAPTDAGLVFAEEARKVLASLDFAVAEARRAGVPRSVIRIGCVPHVPIERLQRFIGAVRERDADMRAQVTHVLTLEQLRRLGSGELDLGLIHDSGDHDGIETVPLFSGKPLGAVLPKGHPLGAKRVLGPDDLKDEVLIIFPRLLNPRLHDWLLGQFEGAGFRFAGVHEVSGEDRRDVLLAVAEGFGVALGPYSAKDVGEADAVVTRRALEPVVTMPDTMLAWRENPPRQLRPVLTSVREVARALRGGFEDGATAAAPAR